MPIDPFVQHMGNTALAPADPGGSAQQGIVVHIVNPEGTFAKHVQLGEIRGNEVYLMDPEPAHLAQNSWLQLTFHPDSPHYSTVVRGVVSYVWTVDAAYHAQLNPGYYVTLSDLLPDLMQRVYGGPPEPQYAPPQPVYEQYPPNNNPMIGNTMPPQPVRYSPEPVPLSGPLHVQAPQMGADATLMVNRQAPMIAPPPEPTPASSGLQVMAESVDGGLRVCLSLVVPGMKGQPVEVFVPFPPHTQAMPIEPDCPADGGVDVALEQHIQSYAGQPAVAPPPPAPAVPPLPTPDNEDEWRSPSHFGH